MNSIKKILVFALTLLSFNLITAQNNGPTAPEATSFEPLDAADMVNLISGDFTYVLPAMNVPNPEGGYPIVLSYHGGIAMDQEASWVGLGWSLNPGAINRYVNGYPDDWKETIVKDFFYDEGWTEDYYNFSIGGTLPSGINIGLGASWGSEKSFGGSVTFGYAGVNFGADSRGVNIGFGGGSSKGLSVSFMSSQGPSLSISAVADISSVGINFSSNSVGISGKVVSSGTITQTQNSYTPNGDFSVRTSGFNFDIGFFNLGFSHTKVSYSLFSLKKSFFSGMLYPYDSKLTIEDYYHEESDTNLMHSFHSMDVLEISPVNYESKVLFPGYDKYSVTAQGISGIIKPRFFEDINLYSKGGANQSHSDWRYRYLTSTPSANDANYNLNDVNGSNFYFENALNSFLRVSKGSINNQNGFPATEINDFNVFNYIKADMDNTYSGEFTPQGNKKKSGNRKREGNFIEVFTNSQIKTNATNSFFLEAKGIDRNNDLTFINDGIGAYKITVSDGKTYYYSLPVYQFETFYRNVDDIDDVDSAFYEKMQEKQYATHWLLTAITGPDYVDKNSNGILDDEDYGYWVEFDYGKWTDGYTWRTPKEGYHEIYNTTFEEAIEDSDITHSYSWGRKQIYYLDAIKTRTHTALFIKNLREDGESTAFDYYDNKIVNGNFNIDYNCKGITSERGQEFGNVGDLFYKADNGGHYLPDQSTSGLPANVWFARQTNLKYIDIPVNKALALKKIILLKNEDITSPNYYKTNGNITTTLTGYCHFNNKYTDISYYQETLGVGWGNGPDLYDKQSFLTSFQIHQHQNVLDIDDIAGLNLELNALKVVDFNYDPNYPLAKQSPNSSSQTSGRLTLESIAFKGKGGVQLIPNYEFKYQKAYINYDKDDIDDWGYHKDEVDVWNLKEIKTPLGSKVEINYESDSFFAEAAFQESELNYSSFGFRTYNGSTSELESYEKSEDFLTFYFADGAISADISTYFSIGQVIRLNFYFYVESEGNINVEDYYLVDSMSSDDWIRLKPFSLTNNHDIIPDVFFNCNDFTPNGISYPSELENGGYCTSYFSLFGYSGGYTENNPNGKIGGGLRVNSINVVEGNENYKTNYLYSNPKTGNISGITSYFPSNYDKNIHFGSQLPSPGVMYEFVTTSSENNGINFGKTVYQFKTLKPKFQSSETLPLPQFGDVLLSESEVNYNMPSYTPNTIELTRKTTIYDNLSHLGRLISVSSFNENNQLMSKVLNNYDSDLNLNGKLGVIQETFNSVYKSIKPPTADPFKNRYYVNSNSKVVYPNILKSTTRIEGGFSSTTYYNKRDFLTGKVLETITEDSKGNVFKTEVVPAYINSNYSGTTNGFGMGAKVDDITNFNMLTQETMSKTYLQVNGEWKEVGVGINTWNNNWTYSNPDGTMDSPTANNEKIWRKHKSYVWDGNLTTKGLLQDFDSSNNDNFDWALNASQPNDKWKLVTETTIYDHYSSPLEVKDINNNYINTKMTDKDTKVSMTANAKYYESFYTGAEYYDTQYSRFEPMIRGDNNSRTTEKAHTGNYSIKLSAGENTFGAVLKANQHRVGDYKLSVWVHKDGYKFARFKEGYNGVTQDFNGEIVRAGDWVQMNHYFNRDSSSIGSDTIFMVVSISGKIHVDDFRIHPISSSLTSYVYNEYDELTYILGSNNLGTYYVYDEEGRLIETHQEVIDSGTFIGGFKKISENKYNYQQN